MAYVRDNREQLLAEAMHEFRAGFKWWEFPENEAKAEQDSRYVGDSWEEPIARWLAGGGTHNQYPQHIPAGAINKVTTTQLLQFALNIEMGKHTRQEQLRVATIMRRMGWIQGKPERVQGALIRFYERPPDTPAPAGPEPAA